MVKALFDTSVLVAALWTNHPKHSACISRLKKVKSGSIQGIICTHNFGINLFRFNSPSYKTSCLSPTCTTINQIKFSRICSNFSLY